MESTSKNESLNNISKEIKDEFKYSFSKDEDNDDNYEKTLEKDIESNCDFSVYVNKLEIPEKSDSELLNLDKIEIVDFKNYQIQKLKAYIISLEKEKEDLIENFKNTTNVLLDKIKENEFKSHGFRPETPFIAKNLTKTTNTSVESANKNKTNITKALQPNNNTTNIYNIELDKLQKMYFGGDENNDKEESKNGMQKGLNSINNMNFNIKQRCPHCTKEFSQEIFLQHSLDCLRNKIRCKKCNELIDEKYKKEHLLEWRTSERILEAINSKNIQLLQKCIDHGASPNKILNEETGDAILHYLTRRGEYKLIEVIIGTELNIDSVNKNQETALIIAITEGHSKIARFLIDLGADLTKRNASDFSPLMLACQYGMVDIARYLVANNAEINEKASISGLTPLTLCKDEELSLFLIEKGAKIQSRPNTSAVKK